MIKMQFADVYEIYQDIFDNINGHIVNAEARKVNNNIENYGNIYGEAKFSSVKEIFTDYALKDKQHNTFLDIGSGIGNIVSAVKLMNFCQICHGVEILPILFKTSIKVKEELKNTYNINNIDFFNQDIFTFDVSNYDIVFANYPFTSKSHGLREKLSEFLSKNMKIGSIFIYNIGVIQDHMMKSWKLLQTKKVTFSWGTSTIRYYQKIA